MSIVTQIRSGSGNSHVATVNEFGALVVGTPSFNSVATVKMEVDDTAYNYIIPKSDYNIIVTNVFLYANKNVGVNDATVNIYTSDVGPAETTIKESLIQTEMLKQSNVMFSNTNLLIDKGRWVNGKTDDDDIFCTILYYYIRATS